jgi:hypothetical protein
MCRVVLWEVLENFPSKGNYGCFGKWNILNTWDWGFKDKTLHDGEIFYSTSYKFTQKIIIFPNFSVGLPRLGSKGGSSTPYYAW